MFQPLELGGGANNLTEGQLLGTTQSAAAFLTNLAGWFNKPQDRDLAYRILSKANEFIGDNPLDAHFLYQIMIQTYYKDRDSKPGALESAIDACKKQIELAPLAAKAFKREFKGDSLSAHVGYTQLSIILDKQGNYTEAIAVCKKAKGQGWAGDWDKRIARYEKKLK